MIATVQLVDSGTLPTLRNVLRTPAAGGVPGLRWVQPAVAAPLALSRPPVPTRSTLIGFWDDEERYDAFVATHPVGRRFSGCLELRLRPLRAYGSWPGLPEDLPRSRSVEHDGAAVVLTLGRLRLSQTIRFLQTSRPAERASTENDGMIWATAAARPPFVATISIWRDGHAARGYAFGQGPHSDAIAEQRRKDFHRQSAFIRFAPLRTDGLLDGPNPVSAAQVH